MYNFNEDAIREAAYYMWEKDGCPCTDGFEYWIKAKEQLSSTCKTSCSKTTSSTSATATSSKSSVKKVVKKVSKPALKFATKLKK